MSVKHYLVEVYYKGSNEERRYNYLSTQPHSAGDEVQVPIGPRSKTAVVTNCYEIREVIEGE